jgi:hypothetical protein
MPFATLDDVNMHLPTDKLEMKEPALDLMGPDAERIIRGYLARVYSGVTIAGWTDPTITDPETVGYVPELVRAIAGRFIAAFYYRERYSEDSLDDPQYAQVKYNEAMALLNQIVCGEVKLWDVVEQPETDLSFTAADFFPNDSDAGPMFSVDDKLFSVDPGRTGLGVKVASG